MNKELEDDYINHIKELEGKVANLMMALELEDSDKVVIPKAEYEYLKECEDRIHKRYSDGAGSAIRDLTNVVGE